jgi:Stage II sporulation protein E (SpoIIE)
MALGIALSVAEAKNSGSGGGQQQGSGDSQGNQSAGSRNGDAPSGNGNSGNGNSAGGDQPGPQATQGNGQPAGNAGKGTGGTASKARTRARTPSTRGSGSSRSRSTGGSSNTASRPSTGSAGRSNSRSSGSAAGQPAPSDGGSTGAGRSGSPGALQLEAAAGPAPAKTSSSPSSTTASGSKLSRRSRRSQSSRSSGPEHGVGGATAGGTIGGLVAATPASSRQPRAERESKGGKPLPAVAQAVTRTVRQVVNVIPREVKLALVALALLAAVGLGIGGIQTRRLTRASLQRAALEEDLDVLHETLLPAAAPSWSQLAVSAAYVPADGAGAGGGFHDAFEIGKGEYAVLVGSVFGGGQSALSQATSFRHAMRGYLRAGFSPRQAVHLAGDALLADRDGGLASVVAAVYDRRGGRLTFCSAAAPRPLVTGVPGPALLAGPVMSPLGMEPIDSLLETTVPLVPGAAVCFYSDGLVEARTEGEPIGEKRLADIAAKLGRRLSAETLLDGVVLATSAVPSDMAACVLRALDEAPTGGPRSEELAVLSSATAEERIREFLVACAVTSVRIEATVSAAMRLIESDGGVLVNIERSRGADISLTGLRHESADDLQRPSDRREPASSSRPA